MVFFPEENSPVAQYDRTSLGPGGSISGSYDTGSESTSGGGNNDSSKKKTAAGITTRINIFTKSDGPVLDVQSGQPLVSSQPVSQQATSGDTLRVQQAQSGRMLEVDGSPFTVIPLPEKSDSDGSEGKLLSRADIQEREGQEVLLVPVSTLVNEMLANAREEAKLEQLLVKVLESQTAPAVAQQGAQTGYQLSPRLVPQMPAGQQTIQTGQLVGQQVSQQTGQQFGQQMTHQITKQAGQQMTQYSLQPTYQLEAQPVGPQMVQAAPQLTGQQIVQLLLQQTGQAVGHRMVQPSFQETGQLLIQPVPQQMVPIMGLPMGQQMGNAVTEETGQVTYKPAVPVSDQQKGLTGHGYCIGQFVQSVSQEVLQPMGSPVIQQPGLLQPVYQQMRQCLGGGVPQQLNPYTGQTLQPTSQQMEYAIGQQAFRVIPGFTQSVYHGLPVEAKKKKKQKKEKRKDRNKNNEDMNALLAKEPRQAPPAPSTQQKDYLREDVITVEIVDTAQNSRCGESDKVCESYCSLSEVEISGGEQALLQPSSRASGPRGDSGKGKGLQYTKHSDYSPPRDIRQLRESKGQARQNQKGACCQECPCTFEDKQARNKLSVCRLSIEAVDFSPGEQSRLSGTPVATTQSQRHSQECIQPLSYQPRRQKGSSGSPASRYSGQAIRASGRPNLRVLDQRISAVPCRGCQTKRPRDQPGRDQSDQQNSALSGQDERNRLPADAAQTKLPLDRPLGGKSVQQSSRATRKRASDQPVSDIAAIFDPLDDQLERDHSMQTRRPSQLPLRDNSAQTTLSTEDLVRDNSAQTSSPVEKLVRDQAAQNRALNSGQSRLPLLQPVLGRLEEASHSDDQSEHTDDIEENMSIDGQSRQPLDSTGDLAHDELGGTRRPSYHAAPEVDRQEKKAIYPEPGQPNHVSGIPFGGPKFEQIRVYEGHIPEEVNPYIDQGDFERKDERNLNGPPGTGVPPPEQQHRRSEVAPSAGKQESSDVEDDGMNVAVWVIFALFIALVVAIFVVFVLLPMARDDGSTTAEPYAESASGGRKGYRPTANAIEERRIVTHTLLERTRRTRRFLDTDDPEWPEWQQYLRVWNL